MRKRRKMNFRKSKKLFRRASRVHKKNTVRSPRRGGYRF